MNVLFNIFDTFASSEVFYPCSQKIFGINVNIVFSCKMRDVAIAKDLHGVAFPYSRELRDKCKHYFLLDQQGGLHAG